MSTKSKSRLLRLFLIATPFLLFVVIYFVVQLPERAFFAVARAMSEGDETALQRLTTPAGWKAVQQQFGSERNSKGRAMRSVGAWLLEASNDGAPSGRFGSVTMDKRYANWRHLYFDVYSDVGFTLTLGFIRTWNGWKLGSFSAT